MRRTPHTLIFLAGLWIILAGSGCGRKNGAEHPPTDFSTLPLTDFQGRILFQSNLDGDNEIYLLSGDGLTQLTTNNWDDGFPAWSPDGESIAFHADPEGQFDIFIMNADGTDLRRITSAPEDEMEPSWFPDGISLSYTHESKGLLRGRGSQHRVDVRTGRTKRLIPDFSGSHGIGNVSSSGLLIALTAKRQRGWDVAVYDIGLKRLRFLEDGGRSCRARFSPDDRSLAYVSSRADGKGDIWAMAPDGSGKTQLTDRPDTYDYFPDWSPDGRFIVFNSSDQHDHDGDWGLFLLEPATGEITPLFDSPGNDVFPDWSGPN